MKKRNRILLVVLALAVMGTLAWIALREPPEPVYKGRTLSAWYQDALEGASKSEHSGAMRNYAEALNHGDTNSWPFLLDMINSKEYSPLRNKLAEWANEHSKIFHHHFWTESDRLGFEIGLFYFIAESGPTPPVSWFLEILDKSKNVGIKVRILYLHNLAATPETVRPVILKALEDNDPEVREAATNALKQIDGVVTNKAGVK